VTAANVKLFSSVQLAEIDRTVSFALNLEAIF
jgi:hypothetical protein